MNGGAQTIRIESEDRMDALDLLRRLQGLHTHLVQLGDQRWHVCVRADRDQEELLAELLRTATEWASERDVASVVRVGERSYRL